MARVSSQSQATSSSTASHPSVVAPRGSATAIAGMRRCRLSGGRSSRSGGGDFGAGNNKLRFYTDNVPGLKITLTIVLFMNLCFIGFVTALHVFGKLYLHRSTGGA